MKINIIVLILAVSSLFPVFCQSQLENAAGSIAQQLTKRIVSKGKKKIAVVEFGYFDDKTTTLDKLLTERVATKLFIGSNDQFRIIERMLLDKILQEHDLEYSGLLEPSKSQRIGKVLGIDALVTGTIAKDGDNLIVNARLIDFETGEWLAAAETNIPFTGTVKELYSTVLSRSTKSLSKPGSVSTEFSKKVNGIILTLTGCHYVDGGILLSFQLKSPNDTIIKWHNPSIIIHDSNGKSFRIKSSVIGNADGRYDYTLIEGIKVDSRLWFEKVTQKPEFIARMDLNVMIGDSWNKLSFRKVHVMK